MGQESWNECNPAAYLPDRGRQVGRWSGWGEGVGSTRGVVSLCGMAGTRRGQPALQTEIGKMIMHTDQLEREIREKTAALQAELNERQRTEETLRESEERYQSLFDGIPVGLYHTTPTGQITDANPALVRMLGYEDREPLLAVNTADIYVNPEERRREQALLERDGVVRSFEAQLRQRDGTIIWMRDTARAIRDDEGQVLYYEGSLEDITERKRAEEALRQRSDQLEALREVGLELTAQLDLDTLLRSIVSRAIELLGGATGGLDLYRPERDVLEWTAAIGPNMAPFGTVLHRGEGLSGKVWETGKPLIVDDYQHWKGRAATWEGYPISAIVGAPVRWGEEFLGVLIVHADPPRTFSPADAELLSLFATQAAIAMRNALLYEAQRKRATQLAVVNQVARKAVSILDPDRLLQEIVTAIQQGFEYYNVALFLLDETASDLEMLAIAGGFEDVAAPGYRQAVEVGIIGWTAQTGRPLLANDVSQEPRYIAGFLEEAVTRSELCVPLKLAGQVIGVLDIQDTQLNAFDERDLTAMKTLANQAAIAIENARLYQAEQRGRDVAEALQETARVVNASLNLDKVLPLILEQLAQVIKYDSSAVLLLGDGRFTVTAGRGLPDMEAALRLSYSADEDNFSSAVMRARRPLIVEDAQSDPRWQPDPSITHIHGWIGVPLIVRDRVIGILTVDSRQPGAYSEEDGQLVFAFANQAATAIENARLFEAERHQRQEAETLREAALALTTSLDRDQVIKRILIQLQQVVPYDSASVQLLARSEIGQSDRLEIVGGHGFPNLPDLLGLSFPVGGNNPNTEVVHTRAPFIVADGPAVYGEFRREPHAQAGIRSWLGVPMLVGEQLVGMIALDKREPGFYTEGHAQLALAFAAQAAIAIENARLFEAEQRRAEEIETLAKVGQAVSSTLDLEQVLQAITTHATTLSHSDEGGIFELDKAEGILRIAASYNASQEFVRAVNEGRVKVGEGTIGIAVATREPVQVVDTETMAGYRFQEIAAIDDIRAVLAVPMFKGKKSLGGIVLWRRKPGPFSSRDVALLTALADQAAIAIENARLYQETHHRAERLAVVNRIARAASGTLHLDDLMETVYREIASIFETDAFFIALYDEETNELDFRIRVDEGIREHPERQPAGSRLTGLIVTEKRPLLIRNFEEEQDRLPQLARLWGTMKAPASWLGVPMRIGDRVVGVISVQAYRPHAYGEEEQVLLSTIADQVAVAVENARLYDETHRRLAREQRLNELAHTLGGEMELVTLIPRLLPLVAELTGADASTAAVFDPDRNVITYPYNYNLPDTLAGVEVPAESGLAGHTMQVRRPVLLDDYREHPAALQPWVEAGVRSLLAVPLLAGDEAVGTLGLFSLGKIWPFGPEAVAAAEASSRLAGVAIQRARLFEAEREQRELAEALEEAAAAVSSTLDTDQVLDRILEQVERVVPGDAFNIMLVEDVTARVVRHRGYEHLGVGPPRAALTIAEHSTLMRMMQTGEPLFIPDTVADADWVLLEGQEWLRSYVAVPIRVTGLTVGFLNVNGTQPGQFGPADTRRLAAFAGHAATAIENAQLYRELRDHAEQLEQRVQERTAQLQAQYARLDAILRSASDGIVVADRQGDILQTNSIAHTWLTQTLSPEDAARLRETVQYLAQRAEERPETVLELTGLDLELRAAPISQPGMEEEAAVVAVHDVSHLKALERVKSRFVSNVSHELRTPITTIKLYAALMQRQPQKWEEYLAPLAQEADRQARLVEDILQISRIDTGRLEMKPWPTSLNQLTEKIVASHEMLAQERGLTLEHHPAEPEPVALADPKRMTQVLNNLVENAIRYTPEGGQVVVSTGQEETEGRVWATATVADTGMGIPEEELPRIFERFFRGEEVRLMQISGTGLGLAIAKEIVELHGGRVTVESQVDVGTTFTIWLPLAEGQA